jgi:hypothetical protein
MRHICCWELYDASLERSRHLRPCTHVESSVFFLWVMFRYCWYQGCNDYGIMNWTGCERPNRGTILQGLEVRAASIPTDSTGAFRNTTQECYRNTNLLDALCQCQYSNGHQQAYIYIECSFCRLIRRPEHLIGRYWYLPANWNRSVLRNRVW